MVGWRCWRAAGLEISAILPPRLALDQSLSRRSGIISSLYGSDCAKRPRDICIASQLPNDRSLSRIASLIVSALLKFLNIDFLVAVDECA